MLVSDTASKDATADKSGPTIRDIVVQYGHQCVQNTIVPDDEEAIRKIVKQWAEQDTIDWIVTTGGTGFGVRDRTPEVSRLECMREGLYADRCSGNYAASRETSSRYRTSPARHIPPEDTLRRAVSTRCGNDQGHTYSDSPRQRQGREGEPRGPPEQQGR